MDIVLFAIAKAKSLCLDDEELVPFYAVMYLYLLKLVEFPIANDRLENLWKEKSVISMLSSFNERFEAGRCREERR